MDRMDVRICAGGVNWIALAGKIALGLTGYYSPLGENSTVSVVATDPGLSCFVGAQWVADRKVDMAISTPDWFVKLAREGNAPFDRPLPLRMLSMFPHDDRMAFAIRREIGIFTFEDLKRSRYPLKVSALPRGTWHPALWGAEAVLAEYGIGFDDILAWGGKILGDRPRYINSPDARLAAEGFDAVFDEALMTRRWKRLTDENDLVFLPLDNDVTERLEAKGWRTSTIERGRFRGVEEDVVAADFSNWALFCHEEMDEQLAYLTIWAIEEQKAEIEALFPEPFAPMTGKLDLGWAARNSPIPLHPGAERYYREHGYL